MAEQIKISQEFAGTVVRSLVDGKSKLVISSPAYYQNQLNKFKDGENVTMILTTKKPKRSEAQNRYLWGVYYPLISIVTGETDLERLHELFKGMFLTTGIVEVCNKKVRMKKSSNDLSVAEFCDFIMKIEAETMVTAPPTENYGLVSLSEGIKQK